jgi:hypothetical protein
MTLETREVKLELSRLSGWYRILLASSSVSLFFAK